MVDNNYLIEIFIREEERKRIGREIHDELGQQLTAIYLDVVWIGKQIPEKETRLKTKLENIIQLLEGSHQSIRRILNESGPGILEDLNLPDALTRLWEQFTANTGVPVTVTTTEMEIHPPGPVVNCIFRVCQEALTNITRYAQATEVSILLNVRKDTILVMIQDNGIGFDVASLKNKKTFGILGMKERVLALGGEYKLVSSAGKGTEIAMQLPVNIINLIPQTS